MFITITRTGLRRIGVGLSAFAVLTAVFILFPRENTQPTAAEQAVPASVSDWGLSFQTAGRQCLRRGTAAVQRVLRR